MDFILNNMNTEFTLEEEKTLGDFLRSITVECEKNEAAIIQIKVNGNELSVADIDKEENKLITDTNSLEITTVAKSDIIFAFKELGKNFEEICIELEKIPVLLQNGKDKEANNTVGKFADLFDDFCHVITLSMLFPVYFCNIKFDGNTAADFLKDFSPLLSDLEQALKDKDTVLIGDLSEYEIKPRLELFAQTVRSL